MLKKKGFKQAFHSKLTCWYWNPTLQNLKWKLDVDMSKWNELPQQPT